MIIGFFIIGAVTGTAVTRIMDIRAALVAAGILAAAFALMFINSDRLYAKLPERYKK